MVKFCDNKINVFKRFQSFDIISYVFRPSRKELKTFSCFDNFVESDKLGSPVYSPDHGAIPHLNLILRNLLDILNLEKSSLDKITVIGFSKVQKDYYIYFLQFSYFVYDIT